jgi:hypothetical protein
MSSERYNQVVDEVYENYLKECENLSSKVLLSDMQAFYKGSITLGPQDSRKIASPYPIEEFINKCKTNPEFSEKWGLNIEDRELSLDERHQIHTDNVSKLNDRPMYVIYDGPESERVNFYDEENIPKKLITLTYNNEIIESYE